MASVLQQALALPREQRSKLTEALLRSLESNTDGETASVWDEAWAAELNHRAKAIDEGRAQLIAHEQVFADLRARFLPR